MAATPSILGKVVVSSAVLILLSFGLCAFGGLVPHMAFVGGVGIACLALGLLGFISVPLFAIVEAILARGPRNFPKSGKLAALSIGSLLLSIICLGLRHKISAGQHLDSILTQAIPICLRVGLVGLVLTIILAIDEGLRVSQKARASRAQPDQQSPPSSDEEPSP